MGPVIAGLGRVVGVFGGYVDKYAGDAILALFGAPVSHEDDPVRALLAAQGLHEEIARLAQTLPAAASGLALHIGVNSGDVVTGIIGSSIRLDYAAMGDAVNTAQRLEAAAPTGQTYVGQSTYELARHRFDFEDVGALTVKGKSLTVRAWRLLGERVEAGAAAPAGGELVGRQRELAIFDRLLDQLAAGTSSIVQVLGEPGAGKTRLAQAVHADAGRRGFHWFRARCLSYGADLPYWPVADLLRRELMPAGVEPTLEELAAALKRRGLENARPYLARLIGVDDEGGSDLEPEAFRRGLLAAVAGFLLEAAGRSPVVLHMEDLHWADTSTLELLEHLKKSLAADPILFYLSTRLEASSSDDTVIRLTALGADDVAAMMSAMLGAQPAPELVVAIRDRTGGNPFFVEEVMRALQERESLMLRDGQWQLTSSDRVAELPRTVQAMLAARLDALAPADVQVLHAAAVLGRRPNLHLLEAVATGVRPAVERLIAARFLKHSAAEPGDFVVFEHALTQEVVYNRMLRRRRCALHLEVAGAAERLFGSTDGTIDLLANHYYRGGAGERALQCLRQAAGRARQLFANREAIAQLERAAEVCREHSELADELSDVLLELGSLQDLIGNYEQALRTYTQARDLGGGVPAWCGMAGVLRKRGEGDAALVVLEDAFLHAGPNADLRPIWLAKGWCLGAALGRYDEAIEANRAGLAVGAATDATTGHLLLQLARNLLAVGRLEEALPDGIKAKEIFRSLEDPRGLSSTLRILGDVYLRTGCHDDAAAALTQGLNLATRVGAAEEIGACLINLGMLEMDRGRIDVATEYDRRALTEFKKSGHAVGSAIATTNLAEKLFLAGAYDEAAVQCHQGQVLARESNLPSILADGQHTLARVLMSQERFDEAAVAASEAAAVFGASGDGERASAAAAVAAAARARLQSS
ncbi:MAG: adenylate/guanylate cyclase domain-containing protein [Mycobacteriales bacterium]